MTVAAFLNSSHYYTSLANVDDVQDIIDALGTILKTTNSPAWTEPVAGTFKSPVDSDGRWFSVAVSRIDVDTLELVVKDQYATTIATKRMDIETAGSPAVEVKIYSGQYHLWIDSCRATYENFRSGILDLSPQVQTAWSTVVYANGHRDSSGSLVNERLIDCIYISGIADNHNLVLFPAASDYAAGKQDPAGNNIFWPVFARNTSSKMLGRMYQVLLGPVDIAHGAEVVVPIDTGVTAKFRCAGVVQYGAGTHLRFMVRAD